MSAQPTGQALDGRTIYADPDDLGYPNLTTLGNHEDGRGRAFSIAVPKDHESGFDFSASYVWQDVEAVAEGASARGISNWRGLTVADRNVPNARRSPHQTTHSWQFNFGYERDIAGLGVRMDVFGHVYTGDLITYTFDLDRGYALFGRAGASENPYDADPLYIRGRADPAVVYAPSFDREVSRTMSRAWRREFTPRTLKSAARSGSGTCVCASRLTAL